MPDNEKPNSGSGSVAKPQLLTDKQFEKLLDTMLYSAVIMGVLAAGKTPTATKANLASLRVYVEGVKELMK